MNMCDDATFPRGARLLDGVGYGTVFKKNKRLANRYWIVLGHKSQSQTSRLGLAIAKKRAKRAVDRNLIKRVARESFRHNRLLLKGFDVVVMNKDPAAKATSIELRQSLDTLWIDLANKK